MHVLEQGQGPAVLLLHSAGLSGAQWRPVFEALRGRFRLIAPDLVGYGGSTPWTHNSHQEIGLSAESLDLEVIAALRAQIVAQTNAPLHLVGHSYGGWLALKSAKQNPQHLQTLSLFDPVAFGVLTADPGLSDAQAIFAHINADGLFFDEVRGGTEPWMERFIDYWGGVGAWRALPESQRARFLRTGRKTFEGVRDLSLDPSPAATYRAIPAPTLLLSGQQSPPEAGRICQILSQTIPSAHFLRVEGGHMAPISQPAQTIAALSSHFDAHPIP